VMKAIAAAIRAVASAVAAATVMPKQKALTNILSLVVSAMSTCNPIVFFINLSQHFSGCYIFALDESMSGADRDKKILATAYPQQVTWPNTNEVRQEGKKPGRVKGVVKKDQDWEDRHRVTFSSVRAPSAPSLGNGPATSNTQGHHNDGLARGTTSESSRGHQNSEQVPESTNSRRHVHHTDERVPGAFIMPGLNDDDSRHSEDSWSESPGISTHGITARVVDVEEEHRVLREQLHQVLREERAHEGVPVIHTAAIDRSVERGDAAANDVDGDVEHGRMTVGQAPIINVNTKLEQASSIHMDSPNSGGFWHGTRGRLLILALILVIVAAAVAVALVLVLGEETPASNPLNSTDETTPPIDTPPPQNSTPTPTPPVDTPPPQNSTPTPTPPVDTPPPQNSTPTPTPPVDTPPPTGANGVCDNAEVLTVDGVVTVGSNVNGSYVLACDTAYYGGTQFNGHGAWYKFIGTGRPLTVSTCTKNTTDFATVVSVLSSTDGTCGDDKLECLGAASGSDGAYYSGCVTPDTGSVVTIDSVAGTTYYASVIGVTNAEGDFGFTIFDDGAGCEDGVAQPVDGVVTVGSNVNGSYVLACDTAYYGGTQFYGHGAWYKFIGTGRSVTVSTCNEETADFATVVSVLNSTDGTCGDDKLECMGAASGSDGAYYSGCNTPDTGSMVTINSVAGTTYYASVIGYGEDVGSFGLSIFDDTPSRRRTLRGLP
jgi:hypothetical protein